MWETLSNNALVVALVTLIVPWLIAEFFRRRKSDAREKAREARECGNEARARMYEDRAKALLALETGVHEQWETHVKDWKKKSDDGKLDPTQRQQAQDGALRTATIIGQGLGVDVPKVLGGKLTAVMEIGKIIRARRRLRREKKQAKHG
jgi:hypothetical protein